VLLSGDGDDDLVEVPFVAPAGGSPADAVGEFAPEFQPHCRLSICFAAQPYVTEMPRAASISSTMRRLSGNWKYSQTA
jgi:hypothetical protein